MELSAEQKSQLRVWVAEGANVAEVQRRIESEFALRMTYMDVRFLIDDLDLALAEKPAPKKTENLEKSPSPGASGPLGGPGKVAVTVDKLMRPGALVSGSVTFTDGVKATWLLDEMGRLGLDGVAPTYRPPADDMAVFQRELQAELKKAGFG